MALAAIAFGLLGGLVLADEPKFHPLDQFTVVPVNPQPPSPVDLSPEHLAFCSGFLDAADPEFMSDEIRRISASLTAAAEMQLPDGEADGLSERRKAGAKFQQDYAAWASSGPHPVKASLLRAAEMMEIQTDCWRSVEAIKEEDAGTSE